VARAIIRQAQNGVRTTSDPIPVRGPDQACEGSGSSVRAAPGVDAVPSDFEALTSPLTKGSARRQLAYSSKILARHSKATLPRANIYRPAR
jgi:hypothetical protein